MAHFEAETNVKNCWQALRSGQHVNHGLAAQTSQSVLQLRGCRADLAQGTS